VYFYVHTAYASSILSNCIIREGSANSGGGLLIQGGNLIAEHCTIANNQASADASAVYIGNSSKLTLRNSIIWGNFGSAPLAIKRVSGTSQISVTNSWIQGGEQGGMASDPLISLTGHLTANSPARNISPAITALKKDIHGELRDALPDAGADEFASSDGDSLPDFWEQQYFGNLTQGEQDDSDAPAGDGLTNYYEYRFGFNPLLPLSPGNAVSDFYEAVFLRKNEANYPQEWTTDTDQDGLTAGEELFYGSNPQLLDSNGDGLGDGLALHLNLSLTSTDTDGDGVSNADEQTNGTNPLLQAS